MNRYGSFTYKCLSHTFAVISIRVSYNKLILTKPSEFISLEVKNLELAKFTLNQETPIIQTVDSVRLPLIKENISPLISIPALNPPAYCKAFEKVSVGFNS